MTKTPQRFQIADARKLLLSSRTATIVIFSLFLLLGLFLVHEGGPVQLSLGTSLVATAVVSVVLVAIDQIRDGEQTRMKELMDTGIVAAFQRRNLEEYSELIATAKHVDVTGYSLRSFSEQNEELLRTRARAGNPIALRILLVNPSSAAAEAMQRAEQLPTGHYRGALDALVKRVGGTPGVSIRLLDKHLSMMIYRIDDTMYTGPYPHSGGSSVALTLKLRQGWVFERQLQDFDALWDQSEEIGDRVKG